MTGRTSLATVPESGASPAVLVTSVAQSPMPTASAKDLHVRLWRVRAHLDGRRAKYVLSVENRAPLAALATTYAFSAGRSGETAAPVQTAVPGHGTLQISFPLDLPRKRPWRAVTEVRLANEIFVFEESARPKRRPWLPPLAGLALAAGLTVLFTSGLGRPNVTALAAPGDVRASRPFAVAYALAAAASADYSVVSSGGSEAARGPLAASEGSFEVALPTTTEPVAYDIHVLAHSRFGDASRTVRVLAEPDPPATPSPVKRVARRAPAARRPPFTIDRLTLGSDTVVGGKPVVAYYRVSSVDGTLRLIDQYGTVRAEALLNKRGNSILLAPYVEADQDLRVVLHAARGTAQAEQSVSVRVTKARSLDDVLAAARRTNAGPIALVAQNVAPGEQIEVGIVHYEPGMRVALVDPQGQEIAASAVVDDQNEVTLTAPAVAGPAQYTVTATYKHGESEETVIRNVTIGGSVSPEPLPSADEAVR